MKQLKVVVNQGVNTLYAQSGGYITANFVSPVEIKKDSLICMDKFNATSKNVSANFSVIQDQFSIVIQYRVNNEKTLVTIPAGSYATILDYMDAINKALNSTALSAFVPTPTDQPTLTGPNLWYAGQSQLGVASTVTITDAVKSQWETRNYGVSPVSTTPSVHWTPSSNIAVDVDGFFYQINGMLGANITSAYPAIKGGGLATRITLSLNSVPANDWDFGFDDQSADELGGRIGQRVGNSNLIMKKNDGAVFTIPNSQTLFPGAYAGSANSRFIIYQKGGYFGFAYCDDITNNNSPVVEYGFQGMLGAGEMGFWDYDIEYYVSGEYQASNGVVAHAIGTADYTPDQDGALDPIITGIFTANTGNSYTILYLNESSQLALVLGFTPQVYFFPNPEQTSSQIISESIINTLQLRSAFELAVEIVDIPLKTYFATSKNSQFAGQGGRQNVVCYFTPEPSIEAQGLYSFANPVHQWLEMDNKSDTYLHSLTFRVFNPYDGTPFISNSMGFNLLIKEPLENSTY
jgi:hypothetical protein